MIGDWVWDERNGPINPQHSHKQIICARVRYTRNTPTIHPFMYICTNTHTHSHTYYTHTHTHVTLITHTCTHTHPKHPPTRFKGRGKGFTSYTPPSIPKLIKPGNIVYLSIPLSPPPKPPKIKPTGSIWLGLGAGQDPRNTILLLVGKGWGWRRIGRTSMSV